MPILIELDPTELQASGVFSRNADLLAIRVSSASFSVPGDLPQDVKGSLSTGIRFTPKDASVLESKAKVLTSFEYVITRSEKNKPKEILVRIDCVLAAIYQLKPGYSPTDGEIRAFHKANVVFNCWPYFREFVQGSASRMNIPPPPVPFVRVQVRQHSQQAIAENLTRRLPGKKKSPHHSSLAEGKQ
jgi:hypothetical protein